MFQKLKALDEPSFRNFLTDYLDTPKKSDAKSVRRYVESNLRKEQNDFNLRNRKEQHSPITQKRTKRGFLKKHLVC